MGEMVAPARATARYSIGQFPAVRQLDDHDVVLSDPRGCERRGGSVHSAGNLPIRDPFGRHAEQGFLVPGVYEGGAFRCFLGVFVEVLEQGLRAPASQFRVGPDLCF